MIEAEPPMGLAPPLRPLPPRLLANRDFRVVLVGEGVSAVGDAVSFTALPLLVLALTGSGFAMGIVGVLQTVPDLLFGLVAGALADRWDRRRMMIYADVGRAILTALIPLSVVLGLPTMGVIILVTAPINLLRVAFMAAYTAAVPNLVGRELIGQATSFFEAVFGLSFIIGPAIAGLLAGAIGPGPTLGIDALSFVVSAAMLGRVNRPLRAQARPSESHLLREIREGVTFVASHPILRMVIAFWSATSIVTASIIPVVTYYVTRDRGLGAEAFGFVVSAYSIGSAAGALSTARLTRGQLGAPLLAGNVVAGTLILILTGTSSLPIMLLAALGTGFANSIVLVSYITLRAAASPDELLGRVGSTARTISLGLQPLGMLAGGALLDLAGGGATLRVISAGVIAVSVGFGLSTTLRTASMARLHRTEPASR